MRKCNSKEYESNQNCFMMTEHVKSYLLYQNDEKISEPWMTVFIPTYKRVTLLKETLASVLQQWHADFLWDVLIVDNEPYDGRANETEMLIRDINNPRITYYRNSENMRPGDNFNRGILLARGQWVMMVHDDDLLVGNAVAKMGSAIKFLLQQKGKPLGAISAAYSQIKYDSEKPAKCVKQFNDENAYFSSLPMTYNFEKITHSHVLFKAHIGGYAPSNGTTYNRKAVLALGGFNEQLGIFADLILFYCMENYYRVYATCTPYGFYRWGANISAKPETTYRLIKENLEFREYVYSQNICTRLMGCLFRNCHYQKFAMDVIGQQVDQEKEKISKYDSIYNKRAGKHWYAIYQFVILPLYDMRKRKQTERLAKKADK